MELRWSSTRPWAPRGTAFVVALSVCLSFSAFSVGPALAALSGTASVDTHVQYRGSTGTTFTFTVNNSSSAGESIGSLQISTPSTTQWTVEGCPSAPSGWTAIGASSATCEYRSGAGASNNIAPGASLSGFRLRASAAAGSNNATGTWKIKLDPDESFGGPLNWVFAGESGQGLRTTIHVWEVLDAVVATAASTPDTGCPPSAKAAPPGSTRVITICGVNHGNVGLTPAAGASSLGGSLIASSGTFASGLIAPAGSSSVVLANYSSTAITPTAAADRTVEVTIGSEATATSPATTLTGYTTDTVPPAAPSAPDLDAASDSGASNTDDITKDTTPTLVGTAEAAATVKIFVDGVQKGTGVATGGNYSVTASALGEGSHAVTATATDEAGNESTVSTALAVTVDTSAAVPSLTARPADPSNDDTPTLSYTGEAGATFDCEAARGSLVIDPYAPCNSGAKTYDLSAEPDATYTFYVRQTDVAGNASPAESTAYTLDRVVSRPTISASPPDPSRDAAPTWSFTGESGATFECLLQAPDGSTRADLDCVSPKTYDLTSESDGLYTFKVRQMDPAGNTSNYGSSGFVLDRSAAPPSITSGPADPSNQDAPTWTFTGESGATFECELKRGTFTVAPFSACDSGSKSYDLSLEVDGVYTFRVRQTDVAGNTSSVATDSYTLDRDPNPPLIAAGPRSPSRDRTPTWSFSGEAGATFECVLEQPDGSALTDGSCSSPKGYDLTGMADGTYTFKVRQTDPAANTSGPAVSSYRLDTLAPRISSLRIGPKPFDPKTRRARIRLHVNEAATVTVKIKKNGTLIRKLRRTELGSAGRVTKYWNGKNSRRRMVKAGRYRVPVTAVDRVGNQATKVGTIRVVRP